MEFFFVTLSCQTRIRVQYETRESGQTVIPEGISPKFEQVSECELHEDEWSCKWMCKNFSENFLPVFSVQMAYLGLLSVETGTKTPQ